MEWVLFIAIAIGVVIGALVLGAVAIGFIFIVAFRRMMRPHQWWRR